MIEQFSKEFMKRAKEVTKDYGEFLDESHYRKRKKRVDAYNRSEAYAASRKKYLNTEKGRKSLKKKQDLRRKRFREACVEVSEEESEAIVLFYANCPKGYEVDHIIPIAKGGLHILENLRYLTKSENRRRNCMLNEKYS